MLNIPKYPCHSAVWETFIDWIYCACTPPEVYPSSSSRCKLNPPVFHHRSHFGRRLNWLKIPRVTSSQPWTQSIVLERSWHIWLVIRWNIIHLRSFTMSYFIALYLSIAASMNFPTRTESVAKSPRLRSNCPTLKDIRTNPKLSDWKRSDIKCRLHSAKWIQVGTNFMIHANFNRNLQWLAHVIKDARNILFPDHVAYSSYSQEIGRHERSRGAFIKTLMTWVIIGTIGIYWPHLSAFHFSPPLAPQAAVKWMFHGGPWSRGWSTELQVGSWSIGPNSGWQRPPKIAWPFVKDTWEVQPKNPKPSKSHN